MLLPAPPRPGDHLPASGCRLRGNLAKSWLTTALSAAFRGFLRLLGEIQEVSGSGSVSAWGRSTLSIPGSG